MLYVGMRFDVDSSAPTIDQVIDERKWLVVDMGARWRSEVGIAAERCQWATADRCSADEASAASEAARDPADRELLGLAEDEEVEQLNSDEKGLSSGRRALESPTPSSS